MSNERTTRQGTVISALRQRLAMTQEEFAHAIGVTVSTVNRWENGHIEPSRLARKAMQGLAAQAAIPVDLEPATGPLIGHVSGGQVGKAL
jgi:DNA-binding transcriptional regulator YiaG